MAEQQWTSAIDSSNTGKGPGEGNIREFLPSAYWKWMGNFRQKGGKGERGKVGVKTMTQIFA